MLLVQAFAQTTTALDKERSGPDRPVLRVAREGLAASEAMFLSVKSPWLADPFPCPGLASGEEEGPDHGSGAAPGSEHTQNSLVGEGGKETGAAI